jgi:hypothetical protein
MPAPKDPVAYTLWKQRMSEARTGDKNANFGKSMSEDQKQKISKTRIDRGVAKGENNPMHGVHLIGEKNGFYGRHHTEKTKQILREGRVGKPAWNKGLPSTWTKGIPISDEVKAKISKTCTGRPKSEEYKQRIRKIKLETTPTGKDSWNWKGGITKLNIHIRQLPRYKNICTDLMKEVDYVDAFTGIRGGILSCHHIIPQNVILRMYNIKTIDEARECTLLFDKHNLIVMLKSAHDKFHNIYGDDKNIYELTPEQIKELYL